MPEKYLCMAWKYSGHHTVLAFHAGACANLIGNVAGSKHLSVVTQLSDTAFIWSHYILNLDRSTSDNKTVRTNERARGMPQNGVDIRVCCCTTALLQNCIATL